VPQKLDKILILPSQKDYTKRLRQFCRKKTPAGRFAGYDSKENKRVIQILREVGEEGDKAVARYTKEFDHVSLKPEDFQVSPKELKKAHKELGQKQPELLATVRRAIENVRRYQTEIFIGNKDANRHPGIKYTPIDKVGVCVPGASAPLPSTVIMTAVPAQVAGVREIVVVSPPRYNGSIHPATLAVCYELGIDKVFRVGGVQAVAALASEKGKIPQVDKIVGPGNKWVQSAKKNVAGDYVAIDSVAGPSEVVIIANEQADSAWVAADMLGQAEHGRDSMAVVLTDSEALAQKILGELEGRLIRLPRAEDARASLLDFGGIIVFETMEKAIEYANELAAEHLQIQCGKKSRDIAEKICNAGAIFIGGYSPVAVGDYWAGPSHTLPTGGSAKFFSALSSNDFLKSTSIIEYDKNMLSASAEDIIRLAEAEGLDAHAESIRIRQKK
jgi:histidinol dehydrogenase